MIDGIIDNVLWTSAPKKVLFVLKEPGAAGDGYSSLQGLFINIWKRQAKYSFINLGRWAYALQKLPQKVKFSETDNKCNRDTAFMSSALINLRKECSDLPDRSCDETRLGKTAQANAVEIKNQILKIDPDIIVCCGGTVFTAVQAILAGEKFKILNMCHPSSRGTAISKYEKLQAALGQT